MTTMTVYGSPEWYQIQNTRDLGNARFVFLTGSSSWISFSFNNYVLSHASAYRKLRTLTTRENGRHHGLTIQVRNNCSIFCQYYNNVSHILMYIMSDTVCLYLTVIFTAYLTLSWTSSLQTLKINIEWTIYIFRRIWGWPRSIRAETFAVRWNWSLAGTTYSYWLKMFVLL